MPSQEEYLDNLLKGIENEDTEEPEVTEDVEESTEAPETLETPEVQEHVEESAPQIDMSDMDDLLQSALSAQKEEETDTAASEETQQTAENTTIHPEETANMSEDEIDRLLQKSKEQSEDAPAQENTDTNDDLIKMLENADEEGLSDILDQVTPETAQTENVEKQPEEDNGKRRKKKKEKKVKEKKTKEKKPGFFDRFKKKPKEEQENAPDGEETVQTTAEETASEIPEAVPDDLADLADLTSLTGNAGSADDTDNTTAAVPENMENNAENSETGGLDDGLDALLAGAFPEQSNATDNNASGEPESADVMDILKAAGADIVDEPEQKKEKKGFFARLLDLFTEEDEEEAEADQLQLSDENKKILEEMDKGGKKKKGKKEKKPKKEKQPKPKKPAKEKKKKEKPEKEEIPAAPGKKLSPKKIIPIVVVCISLGAVILLVGNFLTDYMAKRSGREAYYAGDYQTCYQNLSGKELDETEQVMYGQSESILTIRMWLREYEVFVNEGSELEALDSLLQAVRDYPTLLNYATQWNAQNEVSSAYQDILNILLQKYQLSQEESENLAAVSDNVEYTKNVMLILQKLGLESWDFPEGTTLEETPVPNTEEAPATQLPDPLPEEKEIQQ